MTQAPLTSPVSDPRWATAASIALAPLLLGRRPTGRLLGASQAAIYLRFDLDEAPGVVALLLGDRTSAPEPQGRVPEAAEFLAALGGRGDVAIALAELRSVSATSGTALAVGIVAALDPVRT